MLEALGQAPDRAAWGTLLGWLILRALGEVAGGRDAVEGSAGRRDEWRLGPLLAEALREAGLDDAQARDSALLVQILAGRQDWLGLPGQPRVATALRSWLRDDEVRRFLRVNLYQDVVWFHKEPFEQLLEWALRVTAVGLCSDPSQSPSAVAESLLEACRVAGELRQAEERSGYQLARLEQEAGLPPD